MLSKRKKPSNFKELSVTYLWNSKYSKLFRLLLTTSKAAKKAFACEVTRIIRSEVNMLVSPKSKTVWRENTMGIDHVASFSWEKVHEEGATLCPTLQCVNYFPVPKGICNEKSWKQECVGAPSPRCNNWTNCVNPEARKNETVPGNNRCTTLDFRSISRGKGFFFTCFNKSFFSVSRH